MATEAGPFSPATWWPDAGRVGARPASTPTTKNSPRESPAGDTLPRTRGGTDQGRNNNGTRSKTNSEAQH